MMQFNITGKNIKVTKGIRDYVNKKIAKVLEDFEHPVNCEVILDVEKKRHIAEVILSGDSGRFYLKKSANDLYKSIDLVIQSADISIKKFKDKQKDRKARRDKPVYHRSYNRNIIVKRLQVENIKPMSVEEAILQLKYLKQNILVFRNATNFNTYIL
ncbi:MAG: ribosome-associated translation inhibitor RaiA, partial [Spirochaetes bacterium]|nr:ribosome-associated translation inhibitor RaiA [Spirochaetota bacterium]